MKIEIDTLRDSQAEIRKAILLLQALVERPTVQQMVSPVKNIFESGQSIETPVQSMFGSLFDGQSDEKKTEPKIEYY